MRTIVVLSLAAFALAGCGDSSGPKTEEEVKAAVAVMPTPKAGQYKSTVKITQFEIPGMDPKQAESMKGLFAGTGQSSEYCLTEQQASAGYREQVQKLAQGKCSYDRFDTSGNSLDAKLTCETGKGMTSTIEITGTMGPERSEMKLKTQHSATAGGAAAMIGNAKIEMEVLSERVGDCPA